ncbi:hypothetical protein LNP27_01060 [Flavobacterium galactosidilyticum]|uniref:hypothetical protein n=1 Tax=Flavobacterium galactosidilyticum TaxID=2893886 RepID=UPI001E416405|nr:hypothetical protein [Flavobacterium sp. F-340]UFH46615.1 hypothetical protein LNP27_00890 [Flavobacterium sp. F-340]UFH46649.1 hypothetical protein LNP27_01060 [Flavobacterium sp. F-340]
MPKTKEDRIKTVMGGGGHVVILGAGASIASTFRNGELYGKKLPSMDNFIEILGLEDLISNLPENLIAKNFETLYSNLHKDNPKSDLIKEIEFRISEYFGDMQLPNEPTIYDYLVLSLRGKDLIATFHWDPFLYQAWIRNREFTNDLPRLSFLHGNVAIGYSAEDKRCGPAGMYMRKDGGYFEPTKLLYPIEQKNYTDDEFINTEWDRLKYWLNSDSTKLVTIFGYGAPKSDLEAVQLLNESWGTGEKRNMEQFEIIDIRDEETVRESWDNFIHSHHYDYSNNFFESSLADNPRRTSESYFQHILPMTPDEAFSASNPVNSELKTLEELWDWHRPLIEAEKEYENKNK